MSILNWKRFSLPHRGFLPLAHTIVLVACGTSLAPWMGAYHTLEGDYLCF